MTKQIWDDWVAVRREHIPQESSLCFLLQTSCHWKCRKDIIWPGDLQIVFYFISVKTLPGLFLYCSLQILFLHETYTIVLGLSHCWHKPATHIKLYVICSVPHKVMNTYYSLCAIIEIRSRSQGIYSQYFLFLIASFLHSINSIKLSHKGTALNAIGRGRSMHIWLRRSYNLIRERRYAGIPYLTSTWANALRNVPSWSPSWLLSLSPGFTLTASRFVPERGFRHRLVFENRASY